jgi:hypothetical protein
MYLGKNVTEGTITTSPTSSQANGRAGDDKAYVRLGTVVSDLDPWTSGPDMDHTYH